MAASKDGMPIYTPRQVPDTEDIILLKSWIAEELIRIAQYQQDMVTYLLAQIP